MEKINSLTRVDRGTDSKAVADLAVSPPEKWPEWRGEMVGVEGKAGSGHGAAG